MERAPEAAPGLSVRLLRRQRAGRWWRDARRGVRRVIAASGLWRRPTPEARDAPDGVDRFAFVAGCSRSGTTSLVRLLNSHPAVAVGMERYKYAFDELWPNQIDQALFSLHRFFDFRESDTNVNPDKDGRWVYFYEQLERKIRAGAVTVMGDKVPARFGVMETVHRNFPDPRIIFIFRDPDAVARSYARRARDPDDADWPAWRSSESAIRDWNRAFRAMDLHMARHGGNHVFVVRYEDLFGDDRVLVKAIFAFLGLEPTRAVWDYYEEQQNDARRIRAREAERRSGPVVLGHRQSRRLSRYQGIAAQRKRVWGTKRPLS